MEYLLKNGYVVDPANKIDCERKDIAIKDGKIVESVDESRAKVIDVKDMLVMPGGVDLHSHIAGSKVNIGRLFRPEDHYKDYEVKSGVKRSGVGHSVPSVFTTGYRYAILGYTTVFEPATPPLKTVHTHDELNDIPIVDKACFPLFGNNWFVMEYIRDGKLEECAAYIAWLMRSIRGYAIKVVDPGGVEAWKWGGTVQDFDQEVPRFGITPREIVRGLVKVNKMLGLPHPIHVHANQLGVPGNYKTTLRTLDAVKDLAAGDKPVIHLTHVQFNAYGGVDYLSISSRADAIADYVNKNQHVTIDIGQVIFGDTTTMTADGPFEYKLFTLLRGKWANADVEVETGAGVVPITYSRSNYVHAVMWCIGLELALLINDPWRVFITTDHPNGGPFTEYPRVFSWLMSKKARDRVLKRLPRLARARTNLKDIDREYTFYELAISTRAATAKILGLSNKGHLGVGADADIAVYNINPKEVNPSVDYKLVRQAFSRAYLTMKDGEIVVKDGEIVAAPVGRTYWVNTKAPKDVEDVVIPEVQKLFEDYYTVRFENYYIPESYLACSAPIEPLEPAG
ncbi:MAG: formylmethanofuran dehydrogenase subunit A [Thaumarchaeota archaeon]|nr:formylmethanofuran dehydrogenase subunit A [Nitrososphaerota archaeon]